MIFDVLDNCTKITDALLSTSCSNVPRAFVLVAEISLWLIFFSLKRLFWPLLVAFPLYDKGVPENSLYR